MTGSPTHQLRLPYLDGLRGAAAVYVVMFHAVMGFAVELSGPFRALKLVFGFGHEAVAIFIVLSGYCLMLPVLSRNDGQLKGGFWGYLRRRAFRILPPYFAVVALSLLLIVCVPVLGRAGSGTIWDDSLPGIGLGSIASHLLVVHNWFPAWAHQINGPLWSVASEWQIYFFFPLLLLPLWRRHTPAVVLGCAAVVGYVPLLFARAPAARAAPWYLLLFTLGMLAACVGFSERSGERRWRERIDWRKVCAALWLFCGLAGTLGARIWFRFLPLTDVLVGAATAALLVQCTSQATGRSPRGLVLRALESRLLLGIGHFSYSLYLTHLPVVALCYFALRELGVSSAPVLALAMLVTSVPASLLAAAAFYWAVERHFIKARP